MKKKDGRFDFVEKKFRPKYFLTLYESETSSFKFSKSYDYVKPFISRLISGNSSPNSDFTDFELSLSILNLYSTLIDDKKRTSSQSLSEAINTMKSFHDRTKSPYVLASENSQTGISNELISNLSLSLPILQQKFTEVSKRTLFMFENKIRSCLSLMTDSEELGYPQKQLDIPSQRIPEQKESPSIDFPSPISQNIGFRSHGFEAYGNRDSSIHSNMIQPPPCYNEDKLHEDDSTSELSEDFSDSSSRKSSSPESDSNILNDNDDDIETEEEDDEFTFSTENKYSGHKRKVSELTGPSSVNLFPGPPKKKRKLAARKSPNRDLKKVKLETSITKMKYNFLGTLDLDFDYRFQPDDEGNSIVDIIHLPKIDGKNNDRKIQTFEGGVLVTKNYFCFFKCRNRNLEFSQVSFYQGIIRGQIVVDYQNFGYNIFILQKNAISKFCRYCENDRLIESYDLSKFFSLPRDLEFRDFQLIPFDHEYFCFGLSDGSVYIRQKSSPKESVIVFMNDDGRPVKKLNFLPFSRKEVVSDDKTKKKRSIKEGKIKLSVFWENHVSEIWEISYQLHFIPELMKQDQERDKKNIRMKNGNSEKINLLLTSRRCKKKPNKPYTRLVNHTCLFRIRFANYELPRNLNCCKWFSYENRLILILQRRIFVFMKSQEIFETSKYERIFKGYLFPDLKLSEIIDIFRANENEIYCCLETGRVIPIMILKNQSRNNFENNSSGMSVIEHWKSPDLGRNNDLKIQKFSILRTGWIVYGNSKKMYFVKELES